MWFIRLIMIKKIAFTLLALVILIQFIPMDRNSGEEWTNSDITHAAPTSDTIKQVLHTSCNDCHSDNTVYPWYSSVQPFGFWINDHVEDGKKHLNFSRFKSYSFKRQMHKLDEVVEMMEKKEMPLASYTFIHKNAVIDEAQAETLIAWAKAAKQHILNDSLLTSH